MAGERRTISWARSLRVRAFAVVLSAWLLPISLFAYVSSSDGTVAHAVRAHLQSELARLTLALSPVALLLAWWLGWRTVRPIEQLRRQVLDKATHATAEGELELRRRDELGDLAASFNTLLRALEERRATNEAFVADLVHELKNPLSTIRAAADAIERGGVDAARGERLSRALRDSTQRLDALATAFLELARLTLALSPVALLVAWWLGWRTVRPIEQLRRQVLDKATHATAEGELELRRRDELGD
ncbi:MAG: HAMP domain-containing protein, partial [Polyangiales bacterium]